MIFFPSNTKKSCAHFKSPSENLLLPLLKILGGKYIRGPAKLHHYYIYCEPICPNLFQEYGRITAIIDSSYSIKNS